MHKKLIVHKMLPHYETQIDTEIWGSTVRLKEVFIITCSY